MRWNFYTILFLFIFPLVGCSYLPNTDFTKLDTISVTETSEYIHISPVGLEPKNGFIFVPGGLVDPHAYISLMQIIADEGIDVFILKSEANLSIIEISKPLKLKKEIEHIENWFIGGHSLGGISSQALVHNNSDAFEGLILLGVYPSEPYTLAEWDKHVLSIFSDQDQLSTPEEVEENKAFLPTAFDIVDPSDFEYLLINDPVTFYYLIEGGNHAQFGDYGFQKGDGESSISRTEQHQLTGAAIKNFIFWHE